MTAVLNWFELDYSQAGNKTAPFTDKEVFLSDSKTGRIRQGYWVVNNLHPNGTWSFPSVFSDKRTLVDHWMPIPSIYSKYWLNPEAVVSVSESELDPEVDLIIEVALKAEYSRWLSARYNREKHVWISTNHIEILPALVTGGLLIRSIAPQHKLFTLKGPNSPVWGVK